MACSEPVTFHGFYRSSCRVRHRYLFFFPKVLPSANPSCNVTFATPSQGPCLVYLDRRIPNHHNCRLAFDAGWDASVGGWIIGLAAYNSGCYIGGCLWLCCKCSGANEGLDSAGFALRPWFVHDGTCTRMPTHHECGRRRPATLFEIGLPVFPLASHHPVAHLLELPALC